MPFSERRYRYLGAGLWTDAAGDTLHADPRKLCDEMGWPCDPEHLASAEEATREAIAEHFPGVAVVDL